MQKPVIQRIKRRADVCQSLPVTYGRRGNDTGNGLVTDVSLQYAVDCFLKNGKSAHSKPVTLLLPPAAKCRSGMFFTPGKAYLRHSDTRKRCDYRECRQDARARQYQHDSALCSYFGFFHREKYANRSEKYGAGIIIPDRSIQRTARQVSQDAVEGLIPSETLILCRQQRMIRFKIYRRQFFCTMPTTCKPYR